MSNDTKPNKPKVFFSHSSKDKKVLNKLKEKLLKKTGSAVEIFLSSDGQSIRVGSNWVHGVEDGMDQTHLMMTFLSPYSIDSRWIYFETGFAYRKAREVQKRQDQGHQEKPVLVIPIGILGVDFAELGPPMSLLQGINIKSAEDLNSIIGIINDTFDLEFEKSFTETEYHDIFSEALTESTFGEYQALIYEIIVRTPCDCSQDFAPETVFRLLDDNSVDYQKHRPNSFNVGGMYLSLPSDDTSSKRELYASLIPQHSAVNFKLIDLIVDNVCVEHPNTYSLEINFQSPTASHRDMRRLMASFLGTGIGFDKETKERIFDHIRFKVHVDGRWPVSLEIHYDGQNLRDIRLYELIKILFECEALQIDARWSASTTIG